MRKLRFLVQQNDVFRCFACNFRNKAVGEHEKSSEVRIKIDFCLLRLFSVPLHKIVFRQV